MCASVFPSKTRGISNFPLDSRSFKDVTVCFKLFFFLWKEPSEIFESCFRMFRLEKVMIYQVSDKDTLKVHSLCTYLFYCIC